MNVIASHLRGAYPDHYLNPSSPHTLDDATNNDTQSLVTPATQSILVQGDTSHQHDGNTRIIHSLQVGNTPAGQDYSADFLKA
jgi:hypothetical protein